MDLKAVRGICGKTGTLYLRGQRTLDARTQYITPRRHRLESRNYILQFALLHSDLDDFDLVIHVGRHCG